MADVAVDLAVAFKAVDGDVMWYDPEPQTGWLHGCCDCGLVHRVETKLVNGRLHLRFTREPDGTEILRAQMVKERI